MCLMEIRAINVQTNKNVNKNECNAISGEATNCVYIEVAGYCPRQHQNDHEQCERLRKYFHENLRNEYS